MDKNSIRSRYKKIRSKISHKARKIESIKISSQITRLINQIQPEKICLYYPSDKEVDISTIFSQLNKFKLYAPYLPKSTGSAWRIAKIKDPSIVETNSMNLRQPKEPIETSLTLDESGFTKNDIVLVPGIAFSKKGLRIGFGDGTFDRFLASCGSKKIGVCFKCQLLDEKTADSIETNFYDIWMDRVIYG